MLRPENREHTGFIVSAPQSPVCQYTPRYEKIKETKSLKSLANRKSLTREEQKMKAY